MKTVKPTTTPLSSDWGTYNSESPPMADPSVYNFTRPNVTFAVNHLSQFMQALSEANWTTTIHVVKYLRGTISHGLTYVAGSSLSVQAYCDADWAKSPITRRSVTFFKTLSNAVIYHKSAIHIIENTIFHERTEHIELDCHLIRDHYKNGFIKPYHVPSKSQYQVVAGSSYVLLVVQDEFWFPTFILRGMKDYADYVLGVMRDHAD
ncbi:hypothetical protein LIER_21183 [Lithospermum erythrorhizon]|uniref:Mitochondrial protein n=1 Tax=Lithospermum erythrorhizon TaxID=34254 RepID=A0AAV3QPE1_LITER